MPRDLKADKKICDRATPGPWKWITKGNTVQSRAVTTDTGECGLQKTICASISPKTADAQFITSAREGWPEAIERAIKAEEIVDKYATAARTIALYLQPFCDTSLPYAEMIAEASRRADTQLATYKEENDIQRAAIQQLSAQVVGLTDALRKIKITIEENHPHNTLNLPQYGYSKELHDIAQQVLSSPDPGEKYRAVVEAAKELYYMVINFGDFRNGNSHMGIDEGEVMAGKVIAKFEQTLSALEGGPPCPK